MIKYLQIFLEEFPGELIWMPFNLTEEQLSQGRRGYEAELLEEDRYEMFHHSVAQLMFMISQFRRYINMAASLLITRVKITDEYYCGKLKIVLKYLKGTNHTKLMLIVDSFSVVNWWINE